MIIMSKKVAIEKVILVPTNYPGVDGLTTSYGYPGQNAAGGWSTAGKQPAIDYTSTQKFKGPYGVNSTCADGKKAALKFVSILKVAGAEGRPGMAVFNGHLNESEMILGNYHQPADADGKVGVSVWKDQANSGDGFVVEDGAYSANLQQQNGDNQSYFQAMRNQFAEPGKKYTIAALEGVSIQDIVHITVDSDLVKGSKITVTDMKNQIQYAEDGLNGIQDRADATILGAQNKAESDKKAAQTKVDDALKAKDDAKKLVDASQMEVDNKTETHKSARTLKESNETSFNDAKKAHDNSVTAHTAAKTDLDNATKDKDSKELDRNKSMTNMADKKKILDAAQAAYNTAVAENDTATEKFSTAEANEAASKISFDSAESTMKTAKENMDKAKTEKDTSEADFQKALSELNTVRDDLAKKQQDLDKADESIKQAEQDKIVADSTADQVLAGTTTKVNGLVQLTTPDAQSTLDFAKLKYKALPEASELRGDYWSILTSGEYVPESVYATIEGIKLKDEPRLLTTINEFAKEGLAGANVKVFYNTKQADYSFNLIGNVPEGQGFPASYVGKLALAYIGEEDKKQYAYINMGNGKFLDYSTVGTEDKPSDAVWEMKVFKMKDGKIMIREYKNNVEQGNYSFTKPATATAAPMNKKRSIEDKIDSLVSIQTGLINLIKRKL